MQEHGPKDRSAAVSGRTVERARAALADLIEQPLEAGLYLVATPIGNLGDISLRALAVLARAQLIAAEDTRHSRKLLSHFGIGGELTAYHEHNAARERPRLIARIRAGSAVALISDAGTPLISDPGYRLVREALDEGLKVISLPGPSATLAALTSVGLPTDTFLFAGFLPTKSGPRRRRLGELKAVPATLVLFESAPRLAKSLADMAAVLGPREAALAKELTKLHETVTRGTLDGLAAERQRSPEHDEHQDDHQERHRVAPTFERHRLALLLREIGLEPRDLGLEHPDQQAAEERERERSEAPHQRGSQRRHDQQREPGHREPGDVHDEEYLRYKITESGVSPRAIPGIPGFTHVVSSDEHDENGVLISDEYTNHAKRRAMMEKRMRKVAGIEAAVPKPVLEGPADADVTLIGWGSTDGTIREARARLAEQGVTTNQLQIRYLVPLHGDAIVDILGKAKHTIIVENNFTGQFARYLRSETSFVPDGHIRKYDGEPFMPHHIVAAVREQLAGTTTLSVPTHEVMV